MCHPNAPYCFNVIDFFLYYSVSNGYALTDLELTRFDAIVVSSEVGYEKPAPEIFKIALGIVEFNLFKLSLCLKYIDVHRSDSWIHL
jgi:hypothetical protein